MSKVKKNEVILKVKTNLNDDSKKSKKLFAYVMDKKGAEIERVAIKKGEVKLKIKPEVFRGKRVFIAEALEGDQKVTTKLLERVKAYEPVINLEKDFRIDVGTIPTFPDFNKANCKIVGSVKNHFIIDDKDVILPPVNIRVHIDEVDPWYMFLKRVPKPILIDIRDRLIDVIHERIPHIPIPDPIPHFPDYYKGNLGEGNTVPHPNSLHEYRKLNKKKTFIPPIISDEVMNGLTSQNHYTLRNTILSNYTAFLPYFCWYPHFFPMFYSSEEIAVVNIDDHGRFEFDYSYYKFGDHPDIYIWVEALIDGVWTTVYRPSQHCETYWDYKCGTDINIELHDSRLVSPLAAPLEGQIIWMRNVNKNVSIRSIQQSNAGSAHLDNAVGLTDFSHEGKYVNPFAKLFPLVVQFGDGLLNNSSEITHFRWKYKQIKSAKLLPVDSAYVKSYSKLVTKQYRYKKLNENGELSFYHGAYKLGPEDSDNGPIYKIPNVNAVDDVPEQPTAVWETQNTSTIFINSEDLSDGLYEFIFEFTNDNGAVIHVGDNVFQVTSIGEEIDAATTSAKSISERYLSKDENGLINGFRFVMRIDNTPCDTTIQEVKVFENNTTNAAEVDGSISNGCGFVIYDNKVNNVAELSFEAIHENNFARYEFYTRKGTGVEIGATKANAYVSQIDNGFAKEEDVIGAVKHTFYVKRVNLQDLLGNCDRAAFSENIHVYATHTNGNRRVWEYDKRTSAGFALTQEME